MVLRALGTKTAAEVVDYLVEIFALFGAPRMLHSDNGKEFANWLVKELVRRWPECRIVRGRPRHSQSQGSVERANQDVEVVFQGMKVNRWHFSGFCAPGCVITKRRSGLGHYRWCKS